ncbi:MAG: tetratricopeptide repeat protein [Bacteriovoracaceae bacterium]
MKNLNLLIILTLILQACSSSAPKKSEAIKEPTKDIFGIADINENDFIPKKTKSYNAELDNFKELGVERNSIVNESINRVDSSKIARIMSSEDPITKIIGLCYQKKFNEAEELIQKKVSEYKNHPGFWNQLGTCYYLKQEYRKAILYYNKALDTDAKYVPAINNIGVLYLKDGLYQKALVAFKRAYELNSFSLVPLLNMAHIYLQFGHVEKARNYFEILYKNNQTDVDVINGLAHVALFTDDLKASLSYFKLIGTPDLKRADIGISYAVLLKTLGSDGEAKTVLRQVNMDGADTFKDYYQRSVKFVGI